MSHVRSGVIDSLSQCLECCASLTPEGASTGTAMLRSLLACEAAAVLKALFEYARPLCERCVLRKDCRSGLEAAIQELAVDVSLRPLATSDAADRIAILCPVLCLVYNAHLNAKVEYLDMNHSITLSTTVPGIPGAQTVISLLRSCCCPPFEQETRAVQSVCSLVLSTAACTSDSAQASFCGICFANTRQYTFLFVCTRMQALVCAGAVPLLFDVLRNQCTAHRRLRDQQVDGDGGDIRHASLQCALAACAALCTLCEGGQQEAIAAAAEASAGQVILQVRGQNVSHSSPRAAYYRFLPLLLLSSIWLPPEVARR
jgi:hypothetical protein